jgi:hypothetical protein
MARVSRLRFIQLPSLTEHPPEGANWIHEVKHYGSPKSQHKKCVEFRLLIQVTPHDNRLRPTPMVAHLRYRRLHRIGGDCAPPGQISAAPCLLILRRPTRINQRRSPATRHWGLLRHLGSTQRRR